MEIWIAATLLAGASIFVLLRSLVVDSKPYSSAGQQNIEFYQTQISEIKRQQLHGHISGSDAEAARTEAARSLLSAQAFEPSQHSTSPSRRMGRFAAAVILVALPLISFPVYSYLGSPLVPDMALASRKMPTPTEARLEDIIEQIEKRLANKPDDFRGLELIAGLYMRAGRPGDAAKALSQLNRQFGNSPFRDADLGEALVASADGIVSIEARTAFERALAADANMPKARFYMGRAAAQEHQFDKAREIWSGLISGMPEGPLRNMITSEINKLDAPASQSDKNEVPKVVVP